MPERVTPQHCVHDWVRVHTRDATRCGLLVREEKRRVVLRIADEELPIVVNGVIRMERVYRRDVGTLVCQDDRSKVIGGVGLHTRRAMYANDRIGCIGILVGPFHSLEQAQAVVRDDARLRFASTPPRLHDGDLCALVVDALVLPDVALMLSQRGYETYSPSSRTHPLFCDSLNRAPHLFAAQLPWVKLADVGPTRCLWRYRFHHEAAPFFSWPGLARIVLRACVPFDPMTLHLVMQLPFPNDAIFTIIASVDRSDRLRELDRPLRDHVQQRMHDECAASLAMWTQRATRLRTRMQHDASPQLMQSHAATEYVRRRCERWATPPASQYYITPALDEVVSRAALDAFHLYYYGYKDLSREERELCRATLQHLPRTTGYFVHWSTCYDLSGAFRGLAKGTRRPVDLADPNLPDAVFNRMRRVDSSTITSIGKSLVSKYRGIFDPPPDVEPHRPQRQLLRTAAHDRDLMRGPDE
jgi:hypothetical protein